MGSTDESGKPYPVDIQLKTCLDEFEDDRSEFWQTKTEGGDWGIHERLIGHAEHLARLLLRASEDLVAETDVPQESNQFSIEIEAVLGEFDNGIKVFEYLDGVRADFNHGSSIPTPQEFAESWFESAAPPDDSLLRLVWERLCIEAADDLIGRIVPAANRMLFLYRIAAKSQPSAAVRRFLRRISRCFLWGFYPECLALCRGALDAAFRTAVPDNVCDKHCLRRAKYGHTLANRVRAAFLDGMIDDPTKSRAFSVIEPATTIIHDDPTQVRDILGAVERTIAVIEHLSAHAQSDGGRT